MSDTLWLIGQNRPTWLLGDKRDTCQSTSVVGWDTGIFHSSICLEFDTSNRAEDSFLSPGALQRTSAISSPVQLPFFHWLRCKPAHTTTLREKLRKVLVIPLTFET